MRYILIPAKEIFGNALDTKSKNCTDCVALLNLFAEERAKRKYNIAVVPASLMREFTGKNYFKNNKTAELVKAYVDVDESVLTDNIDADYFEVARINADKEPIIVIDTEDIEAFRGQHTTPVFSVKRALEFVKENDSGF